MKVYEIKLGSEKGSGVDSTEMRDGKISRGVENAGLLPSK